jgi:hypothetical protein
MPTLAGRLYTLKATCCDQLLLNKAFFVDKDCTFNYLRDIISQ